MKNLEIPEDIFDLVSQIQGLQKQLAELQQQFWKRVRSGTASPKAITSFSLQDIELSKSERIYQFFKSHVGKEVDANELKDALPDIDPKYIRSTLTRFTKYEPNRGIKKVKRGIYTFEG